MRANNAGRFETCPYGTTATTTTTNGIHYKLWITHPTITHYALRIMNYNNGCIPQQLCITNYEFIHSVGNEMPLIFL